MANDMTLLKLFSDIKHAQEQKQFVVLSPEQALAVVQLVLDSPGAAQQCLKEYAAIKS